MWGLPRCGGAPTSGQSPIEPKIVYDYLPFGCFKRKITINKSPAAIGNLESP